tara:strand:- start:1637 stop:2803 length:1167 start_codon:yes stop_codon:yes gene_type:complete
LECGKVVLTRLRSTEYYKNKPLNHIIDSYYHLLENFIQEHDNEWPYSFDTHNCSLPSREKNRTNVRDFERIKDSDVLIIPSESEFAYNISGRISNILMGRSWGMVEYMRQALKDNPKPRKIILLTSDKADTIELYRDKVFKGVPRITFYQIDESEFPGGIHHLKHINIKKQKLDTTNKQTDFGYWGTSKRFKIDATSEMKDYEVKDYFKDGKIVKYGTDGAELKTKFVEPLYIGKESKDERHLILKEIYKDNDISKNLIGYFDGFKYTHKFDKNMINILPYMVDTKFTLCFNWPGEEKHLTSRYNEALGCDIIPLVWGDYDCDNQLVLDDRQRMRSFDDIKKCLTSTSESDRLQWLNSIQEKYLSVTKPIEYYEDLFNQKLLEILNDR